jgi:hypothetical protein
LSDILPNRRYEPYFYLVAAYYTSYSQPPVVTGLKGPGAAGKGQRRCRYTRDGSDVTSRAA